MPKPSSLPLILVVMGVGVGALALLNFAQFQNRPRSEQEMEQEAAEREAKANQNKPATPAPTTEQSPANQLVVFQNDTTLGSPKATKTVTVGYEWTPDVQADPMRVFGPVTMIEKAAGRMVRVRVVNLSDPAAPRVPPGISIAGKVVLPLRPEGGFDANSMQQTMPLLMQAGPPQ